MGKRVVVITSGETERRALPHLLRHLEATGATAADVRIPPRNLPLSPDMAEKLIKASWFANLQMRPNKFVVLLDTDRQNPASVMKPFEKTLPSRLASIGASVLYAYAQRHLEAWYFADANGLRAYLGRALGSIDPSKPDEIESPKLHLQHLLDGRVYTARVSEKIAQTLDPEQIAQRSPSFRRFIQAVMNGAAPNA